MTKNEELEILRDTVRRLGPDSYCGPWLAETLPALESDMLSDISPTASMKEARATAARIIADATERGAELVRIAQSRANDIERQAYGCRDAVAAAIRHAERILNNY